VDSRGRETNLEARVVVHEEMAVIWTVDGIEDGETEVNLGFVLEVEYIVLEDCIWCVKKREKLGLTIWLMVLSSITGYMVVAQPEMIRTRTKKVLGGELGSNPKH